MPMYPICTPHLPGPGATKSTSCQSSCERLCEGLLELHIWIHIQQLPWAVQPRVSDWPGEQLLNGTTFLLQPEPHGHCGFWVYGNQLQMYDTARLVQKYRDHFNLICSPMEIFGGGSFHCHNLSSAMQWLASFDDLRSISDSNNFSSCIFWGLQLIRKISLSFHLK